MRGKGDGPSYKGAQRNWVGLGSRGCVSLGCTTLRAPAPFIQRAVLWRMEAGRWASGSQFRSQLSHYLEEVYCEHPVTGWREVVTRRRWARDDGAFQEQ